MNSSSLLYGFTVASLSHTFWSITVDSRYFELGYLEFCELRNVYLNKKNHFDCFSNHNLALKTFLQVQITRKSPTPDYGWRKPSK